MTPSEVMQECSVLGNRKPNSDIWDENNRKERAEKINSHTNKNTDLVYPKQELCGYVHRVAAIFNIATTRVTGSLAHIYDPGLHT